MTTWMVLLAFFAVLFLGGNLALQMYLYDQREKMWMRMLGSKLEIPLSSMAGEEPAPAPPSPKREPRRVTVQLPLGAMSKNA